MSKSKARRKRDHILRNTGRDLTKLRSTLPDFSIMERTTKTKKETIAKDQTKHKKRSPHERDIPLSGDRFLFSLCTYLHYSSIKNSFQELSFSLVIRFHHGVSLPRWFQ
ncbi:hypothetical protein F0342_08800 [Bacillus sp. CH30_1T]|nr:hypothetical protein F0342_08800 [Bacillus sp. CH30_1T]